MAKFLKFIVGLVLAVFLVAGAALILPSFIGYDTVVVQGNTQSNLALGTVVYAQQEAKDSIKTGNRVLVLQENEVYVNTVQSVDAESGKVEYTDGTSEDLQAEQTFSKVVLTVPFLGFLSMATQTFEGVILLALVLAVLIVLFVIAEVLGKRKAEELAAEEEQAEENEEEEDAFYRDLAAKKRAADAEADARARKKHAEKKAETSDRRQTSGGRRERKEENRKAKRTPDEKPQTKEKSGVTGALPDVQAALEAALETQQMNRSSVTADNTEAVSVSEAAEEAQAPSEIELAIPALSADELLSKAYARGLDPVVREDEITGLTLVDYSDCL